MRQGFTQFVTESSDSDDEGSQCDLKCIYLGGMQYAHYNPNKRWRARNVIQTQIYINKATDVFRPSVDTNSKVIQQSPMSNIEFKWNTGLSYKKAPYEQGVLEGEPGAERTVWLPT